MNTIFWAKEHSSSHDDKYVRITQTKSGFHSRNILIMAFFFFFHFPKSTCLSTLNPEHTRIYRNSWESSSSPDEPWPSHRHLYRGWKDKLFCKFCILKAAPNYPPCPATSVVSLMLGTSSRVLLNHSNSEHSRKKMPNVSAAGLKPASLTSRDFLPWSFGSVPSGRVCCPHVTHLPCCFRQENPFCQC